VDQERYVGILVGLITAIVTLILLALLDQREAASKVQVECMDLDTRERVRKLSFDAYDQAFRDHTVKLFVLWVQDPYDQPKRARAGTQANISAYVRAREFAENWNPPTCPPEK
jgi:hypothetical protein